MNKETQNIITDAWQSFTRMLEEELDSQDEMVIDFQDRYSSAKDKTTFSLTGTVKGKKIINATLTVLPEGAKSKKKKKSQNHTETEDK